MQLATNVRLLWSKNKVTNNESALVLVEGIMRHEPMPSILLYNFVNYLDPNDNTSFYVINGSTGLPVVSETVITVRYPILYLHSDTSILIETDLVDGVEILYTVTLEQIEWRWFAALAVIALVTYFIFLLSCICCLPCCCCCGAKNKDIPYYKREDNKMLYVFKMPEPLTNRKMPSILAYLFRKPVVEFIAYCICNNEVLWMYYPDINETISTLGRCYVTFLSLLFVFTFQGILAIKLFHGFSGFLFTLVKAAISYVIILVFTTILKFVFRRISRRPSEMFFSSSKHVALRILGMILNYGVVICSLGVAGLCIYVIYWDAKLELAFVLYNFYIFASAVGGRLTFPGVITNYITYRIYGTVGKFPDAILEYDTNYRAHYVRGRQSNENISALSVNSTLLSTYLNANAPGSNENEPLLASPPSIHVRQVEDE